jgi:hypothetical protein
MSLKIIAGQTMSEVAFCVLESWTIFDCAVCVTQVRANVRDGMKATNATNAITKRLNPKVKVLIFLIFYFSSF